MQYNVNTCSSILSFSKILTVQTLPEMSVTPLRTGPVSFLYDLCGLRRMLEDSNIGLYSAHDGGLGLFTAITKQKLHASCFLIC